MIKFAACTLTLVIGLSACERGPTPEQQRAAAERALVAKAQARAAKELDTYRQLVAAGNYELAAALGKRLLSIYPNSSISVEVQKTLADVEAKATAATDTRRLPRLWMYQADVESGGKQTTASIFSSQPSGAEQVRLLLRKHSDWGQSVYVYAAGKGFVLLCAQSSGDVPGDAAASSVKARCSGV